MCLIKWGNFDFIYLYVQVVSHFLYGEFKVLYNFALCFLSKVNTVTAVSEQLRREIQSSETQLLSLFT